MRAVTNIKIELTNLLADLSKEDVAQYRAWSTDRGWDFEIEGKEDICKKIVELTESIDEIHELIRKADILDTIEASLKYFKELIK